MELRIWSLFGFFVVLTVVSHCSVNAHVMERREVDDGDFLGDEGIDDEAQKDEGNDIPIVGVIQTVGKEYTPEPGQSVRLACVVSPESVSVVNWHRIEGDEVVSLYMNTMKMMKQDNPLYNKTRIISEGGVHDLVIEDVTAADAGEYRCQLLQTEPTFVVHRVKIVSEPRIISLHATNNGTVPEGSDLVLTCKVVGLPPPKILWSRVTPGSENANVRLGENDGEFSFDSVTIKKVKGHHSGRYYCYAFNSLGQAQEEVIINVLEKPHAHVHKKEINTGIGDHAMFQCSTRGTPVPQITWFKDNVPVLVDGQRFFISTDGARSNLTVVPAGAHDFGTYTCVAQNYHGVHNKSAELVQRPVIDDVDVDGVKIDFRVHSHLPLEQVEIQLMDQTGNMNKYELPRPKNLQKSYKFSYEVKDLTPGAYQAFIRAKNEKDWSRNTDPIKMNIEAEPINIQQSSIYRANSAHSILHSTALLSTASIYLLIRML